MHLSLLPTPIILRIVARLNQHDLNSLVKTSHRLYDFLLNHLYRRSDIQARQALFHHCHIGYLRALRALFTAFDTLPPQAQHVWKAWLSWYVKNPFRPVRNSFQCIIEKRTNPLHLAVENGHLIIAEYLLFERDFLVDDTDYMVSDGETALTLAAARGDLEMVKLLLFAGADIFYSPPLADNNTALDQSVRNHQWHVAHFLLPEMKQRINLLPDGRRERRLRRLESSVAARVLQGDVSPLLSAAIRDDDTDSVDALLSDLVPGVLAGDVGAELLEDAFGARSVEMIRLLLRHGADPNLMRSNELRTWNTTLQAAVFGEVETVRALVKEGGGDPDVRDHEGRTPLSYAAERNHVEVVRLLVGYGVDVGLRDSVRGWRALDWAVQWKKTRVAEMLEPLTEGGLVVTI
ncbi:ankyrin repeat-containing domain protein [Aspergillus karnatakaensis]|uniref:ankyrin repeat domain-containing protein n=1 Tax=Aspergillus karnatakaensis TaxID=1810916 RepID=UPI003CCCCCFF